MDEQLVLGDGHVVVEFVRGLVERDVLVAHVELLLQQQHDVRVELVRHAGASAGSAALAGRLLLLGGLTAAGISSRSGLGRVSVCQVQCIHARGELCALRVDDVELGVLEAPATHRVSLQGRQHVVDVARHSQHRHAGGRVADLDAGGRHA